MDVWYAYTATCTGAIILSSSASSTSRAIVTSSCDPDDDLAYLQREIINTPVRHADVELGKTVYIRYGSPCYEPFLSIGKLGLI